MARVTITEVRNNINRINEITGKKYRLYSAYGNYGLMKEVNEHGGVRDIKIGITLKETNYILLGMLEILEA